MIVNDMCPRLSFFRGEQCAFLLSSLQTGLNTPVMPCIMMIENRHPKYNQGLYDGNDYYALKSCMHAIKLDLTSTGST
jgi:hypothetical protein